MEQPYSVIIFDPTVHPVIYELCFTVRTPFGGALSLKNAYRIGGGISKGWINEEVFTCRIVHEGCHTLKIARGKSIPLFSC